MKISEKLHHNVIIKMRKTIADAEGQEVLFVIKNDENGQGNEVVTAARGNDTAAPVVFHLAEKGDTIVHNHPSGVLKPSGHDISVASRLANQGIGFYIINNLVSKVYCVTESVTGGRVVPMDKENLCSILLPGGLLSREFVHYEVRDPQVEMLEGVIDAFNNEHINVTEAGTGVGKSFSYLIPSLTWAVVNKERVIISTATINLQQQLIEKDIPVIQKIIGTNIKCVLVKGRGNYICLRRMEEAFREQSLFNEEASELIALHQWAGSTQSGSKSDLTFVPKRTLWNRVCSESDSCMGMKCPHREGCFVLKVRKEAASAHILVVNHHLLFSDLAMRIGGAGFEGTAVLPPFNRIIFDEAHTVEKSATSFFSENYSKYALFKNLGALYGRKRRIAYGILEKIKHLIPSPDELSSLPGVITTIKDNAEQLEQTTRIYLEGKKSRRILSGEESGSLKNLVNAMYTLHSSILKFIQTIHDGVGELFTEVDDDPDVFNLRITLHRLVTICGVLGAFQDISERDEKIFWIEEKQTGKKEIFYSFSITPLDVSAMMKEAVFDTQSTVVFTSATLTVQKKFDFWNRRVGLSLPNEHEIVYTRLESPFEYRKQVLLAVPTDGPDPSSEKFQNYINDIIQKILEISEGKSLVLFTSYSMLRKTYGKILPFLEQMGITVLQQGDDDRARLLNTFNSDVSSVLFATNSFWEGVDVPGDALKIVIICKLPFQVPTDPIVKARMDRIEEMGGNPFFELSLPEAAMRLKQGFGRLMRRKSDHGIVVILDPRIIRKSYGKVLLGSLPETAKSITSGKEMLTDIENFLYS